VPDCVTVLFHACETDWPAGMSKSIRQSLSCIMFGLVTVKLAMKPVCHACDTDNVAMAAAARATGAMPGLKIATIKADKVT